MKRLLSFLLSLVLLLSLVTSVSASSSEAIEAANALHERGLFNGTGTNADGTPIFDLDKTPTRNQAIIMLIRLLGKEDEALAGSWSIPFTDVSENMKPYVGYAYTNGLTSGMSATTYGGNKPISVNQYISFVLRSLGYVSGADFTVSSATVLSNQLGITSGQYDNVSTFTRGDVAIISNNALNAKMKGSSTTLQAGLNITGSEKRAASNIEKAEIVDIIISGLKIQRQSVQQALNELQVALTSGNSDEYLMPTYLRILQAEQERSKVSLGFYQNAINLCNKYTNTQVAKEYLVEIYTAYFDLYSYEITVNNLMDYMQFRESVEEKAELLGSKCLAEFDVNL